MNDLKSKVINKFEHHENVDMQFYEEKGMKTMKIQSQAVVSQNLPF
jgi:hypothetical protein